MPNIEVFLLRMHMSLLWRTCGTCRRWAAPRAQRDPVGAVRRDLQREDPGSAPADGRSRVSRPGAPPDRPLRAQSRPGRGACRARPPRTQSMSCYAMPWWEDACALGYPFCAQGGEGESTHGRLMSCHRRSRAEFRTHAVAGSPSLFSAGLCARSGGKASALFASPVVTGGVAVPRLACRQSRALSPHGEGIPSPLGEGTDTHACVGRTVNVDDAHVSAASGLVMEPAAEAPRDGLRSSYGSRYPGEHQEQQGSRDTHPRGTRGPRASLGAESSHARPSRALPGARACARRGVLWYHAHDPDQSHEAAGG